jgi:hypothetical protein
MATSHCFLRCLIPQVVGLSDGSRRMPIGNVNRYSLGA